MSNSELSNSELLINDPLFFVYNPNKVSIYENNNIISDISFICYEVSNLDSSNNEYFERITNDINVIDYLNVLELSSVTLNFDTVFKTLYKDSNNESFKKTYEITNYDQFSHIKRFDICNNHHDLLTDLLTDISYYYNNDKFIEINTN